MTSLEWLKSEKQLIGALQLRDKKCTQQHFDRKQMLVTKGNERKPSPSMFSFLSARNHVQGNMAL